MAKRRKIEETKEDDDHHIHHQDQQNNVVSDRLSGLPDNLIRHILSLLPIGDAFRTRRLCKAWFLAWASDPVLDVNNQENFVNFVDKTLLQFKDNVLIQKFKLYKLIYGEDIDRVENLLSFVAERNVRELDIDTKSNQIPYTLSQSVLHANSLKVLKLVNLTLKLNNNVDFVTLKSFKILSLKYVNLDDESARKIISSCSSLEQFDLLFCIGLKRLTISNSKLKALKIADCKCSRIEFELATSLETFSYTGHWIGDIGRLGENGTQPNLKVLRLWLRAIKDATSLQDRISRLPRLERLELAWRGGAQQFTICNKTLRHLELDTGLFHKVRVNVDAPNMISFEYNKRLISISSLNAPKLLVG